MPRNPWKVLARLVPALVCIAILGGCATPYQPLSLTGGYREREVGPNRWYVESFGNGNTSRDTVMAYGLYRCAELTVEKGFDYFVVVSKTPRPEARFEGPEFRDAAGAGEDRPQILRTPGSGDDDASMYVPATTITTWSWRGVIELRKGSADSEERPAFVARAILDKLGPAVRVAVDKGTNVILPKGLFAREESTPRPAGRGVRLEDLDALLPKE